LQEFRSSEIERRSPGIGRTRNQREGGDSPIHSATPELRQLLNSCLTLFIFVLFPFLPVSAQVAAPEQNDLAAQLPRLSDGAQVSLITYSPGEELYQAFGHSAIRVRDDLLGMDRLYNYGVFDFETPNFYTKFVHGDLRYQLAVSSSEEEIRAVGAYGQGVTELALNLSPSQKQGLFEALEINLLPENRFYQYDFILDNCSTRPRDMIERITGSPVTVRDAGKQTFRDMLDPYFTRIPWAGLGVSLLMGARIDRPASPREACFLPADLERAVETSQSGDQNLVGEKKIIFSPAVMARSWPFLTPIWVFFGFGILWFLFWLLRRKAHSRWLTALFLMFLGLVGTFILVLSCWTRLWVLHDNYNLWWLIPLHFPAGLWLLLSRRRPAFLKAYLWFAFLDAIAFFCFSFLLPQRFNLAVYPLLIIVAWRCALEIFPVPPVHETSPA
jgi:hypothetical protein